MKKLFASIAIVGMITGAMIDKSNAAIYAKTEISYYADAAKTQLVGVYESTCSGVVTMEGEQSSYYTIETTPCSDPGCFDTPQGCYNDI